MKMKIFPLDRQLDTMDCGPSCLKMIAKYYGRYYSLQYLRDLCGLGKEGVSLAGIGYAAERIGFRSVAVKCSTDDVLRNIPLPDILHWENAHFVVIYKVSNRDLIYVSDPAKGYLQFTKQSFEKYWALSRNKNGYCLLLEPSADFKNINQEHSIKRKKTLENFLSYLAPYQKSFLNLFALMLLITIMQATLPFVSKAVIDVGIQTQDLNFIDIVLIANIALVLSITISNVARDWILQHLTARINVALISDYLIKLMKLPITFFETKLTGDILQRANDHERIRNFIMNNSLNLIFSSLTFVVFGVILWIYDSVIFSIFLIGSLLYIIWVVGFFNIRKKLDWNYFELTAKNQGYWVETINTISDIKINNYERPKRWKWENIQAQLYKVNLKMLKINNGQTLGAQAIESLKNIFITFYCAKAVIAGEITFGVMISTQFIIGMLNAPVSQLIQFVIGFQVAQISFLRLNEIHQLADEDVNIASNSFDIPKEKSLHMNQVVFQYDTTSPPVLRGLNIGIPEGKVTAIVGDSGSGKSTLLKLLLRIYKPTYGDITIGNINIRNVSLRRWREKCGAVLQDGKIFNDTILNNISLEDENLDMERLRRAVEVANIGNEIEKLPLGYQTMMGEQGRGLSGGQRQRILIARALYKDPDYLFFDEATNSLDTINEQKIVTALDDVFKGKTVVVVAHRLSTIRKADQIIVLKNGSVVEIGNHDELLQLEGVYHKLIQTQMDLIA